MNELRLRYGDYEEIVVKVIETLSVDGDPRNDVEREISERFSVTCDINGITTIESAREWIDINSDDKDEILLFVRQEFDESAEWA